MCPDIAIVREATSEQISDCARCGANAHGLGALPSPDRDGLASLGLAQPPRPEDAAGRADSVVQKISSSIRSKASSGNVHSAIRWISHFAQTGEDDASIGEDKLQLPHLCTRTRQSIVFKNPALLRATTSFHALQHFGMLFQSSAGSAETYSLSEPVSAIDVFVSHNWSTERSAKFITLALYFNLRVAVLTVAIAVAIVVLLVAFGVLPTFVATHPTLGKKRVSIACRVTGLVVFFVTLLFGHELKGRLGFKGSRLFIDKAVIHQTDVELKREGIQHLAAFLAKSDRMVIVYTAETYLKKLWTVYELASMLVLRPIRSVVIIPTSLSKLVLAVLPLVSFNSVMHTLSRSERFWELLNLGYGKQIAVMLANALSLLLFVPIAVRQWHWGRQCQQLRNSMKHFSIQSTHCACEEDRAVLFGNIAAFMRDVDLAGPDVSEVEALEAFNGFVRSQLPMALSTFGGCRAIPYKYSVVMSMPWILSAADNLAVSDLHNRARSDCIWMFFYTTLGLAIAPIWFYICQRAYRDASWACGMVKCVMGICFVWVLTAVVFYMLGVRSETSDLALLIYLGMIVAWYMAAAFLYHPRAVADSPSAQRPNSHGNV